MKVNTSHLAGPALRYAVCLALGYKFDMAKEDPYRRPGSTDIWVERPDGSKGWVDFRAECQRVDFDIDFALGAPILDREKIDIRHRPEPWHDVEATWRGGSPINHFGPTMLIAGMRCFVASKMGDSVDVPDILLCPPAVKNEVEAARPRRARM